MVFLSVLLQPAPYHSISVTDDACPGEPDNGQPQL